MILFRPVVYQQKMRTKNRIALRRIFHKVAPKTLHYPTMALKLMATAIVPLQEARSTWTHCRQLTLGSFRPSQKKIYSEHLCAKRPL